MKSERPHLRVISSTRRTVTVSKEDAEGAALEDAVRRAEAHRHVAHLRLLARQLPLWEPDAFQRVLTRIADDYARKFADDGEAA